MCPIRALVAPVLIHLCSIRRVYDFTQPNASVADFAPEFITYFQQVDVRQLCTNVAGHLNTLLTPTVCPGYARCAYHRKRWLWQGVVVLAIPAYLIAASHAPSSAFMLFLPAAVVAVYHGALAMKLYTMYGVVDTKCFEPKKATPEFYTPPPPIYTPLPPNYTPLPPNLHRMSGIDRVNDSVTMIIHL